MSPQHPAQDQHYPRTEDIVSTCEDISPSQKASPPRDPEIKPVTDKFVFTASVSFPGSLLLEVAVLTGSTGNEIWGWMTDDHDLQKTRSKKKNQNKTKKENGSTYVHSNPF